MDHRFKTKLLLFSGWILAAFFLCCTVLLMARTAPHQSKALPGEGKGKASAPTSSAESADSYALQNYTENAVIYYAGQLIPYLGNNADNDPGYWLGRPLFGTMLELPRMVRRLGCDVEEEERALLQEILDLGLRAIEQGGSADAGAASAPDFFVPDSFADYSFAVCSYFQDQTQFPYLYALLVLSPDEKNAYYGYCTADGQAHWADISTESEWLKSEFYQFYL